MPSCIMLRLPTSLVQELNVGIVEWRILSITNYHCQLKGPGSEFGLPLMAHTGGHRSVNWLVPYLIPLEDHHIYYCIKCCYYSPNSLSHCNLIWLYTLHPQNLIHNPFTSGAYIWYDNFKQNSLILLKFEKKIGEGLLNPTSTVTFNEIFIKILLFYQNHYMYVRQWVCFRCKWVNTTL